MEGKVKVEDLHSFERTDQNVECNYSRFSKMMTEIRYSSGFGSLLVFNSEQQNLHNHSRTRFPHQTKNGLRRRFQPR